MKASIFVLSSILVLVICSCSPTYVVMHNPSIEKRRAAVQMITDQNLLYDLAINENMKLMVRVDAVEAMTDIEYLKKVIFYEMPQSYIGMVAVKKISNQDLLMEFVKNENLDVDIHTAAIEKITDQSILIEISEDKNVSLLCREFAMEKIIDEEYLKRTVYNDELDYDTRGDAAQRITDHDVLISILYDDELLGYVRECAISNIIDQISLKKIAKDEELSWYIKVKAADKIIDQDFLVDILKSQDDITRIKDFITCLKDQAVLLSIAQGGSSYIVPEYNLNPSVQMEAIWQLESIEDIVKLGQSSAELSIKYSSSRRVQYLFGGEYYSQVNIYKIDHLCEVLQLLIDPNVIERHGSLKITTSKSEKEKTYYKIEGKYGQRKILVTVSNHITLSDTTGKIVFEKEYVPLPARRVEYFRSTQYSGQRTGKIDYNDIKEFLLNENTSKIEYPGP